MSSLILPSTSSLIPLLLPNLNLPHCLPTMPPHHHPHSSILGPLQSTSVWNASDCHMNCTATALRSEAGERKRKRKRKREKERERERKRERERERERERDLHQCLPGFQRLAALRYKKLERQTDREGERNHSFPLSLSLPLRAILSSFLIVDFLSHPFDLLNFLLLVVALLFAGSA